MPVQASVRMALPLNRLYVLDSRISRFILQISVHDFMPLFYEYGSRNINPLNPELNPICYLLALLGAHHFLHVSK